MRIISAVVVGVLVSCANFAFAADPAPTRPIAGGVVAIWLGGPNVDREAILKMPFVKGGQVVAQWAEVEPQKGKYDFSVFDKQFEELAKRGLPATIQLNGNRKPRYLFDEVPYVKETSRDLPSFRQVQNQDGTLMYWHPAHERAYVNFLTAFRDYLAASKYKKSIIGLRMNFNPFGTEGVTITPDAKAAEYADKKRWIQPAGLDKTLAYEGYNKKDSLAYLRRIIDKHIELFGNSVPMFVRCTADRDVLDGFGKHLELGTFGVFETASCCSPFGSKLEDVEASMVKYCKTGKTVGYAESFSDSWGFHGVVDRLILPPPQEFYWRVLCDLHKGVSYVAVYGKDLNVALTGTYKVSARSTDGKQVDINYSDRASGFNYKKEFGEALAFADKYAGRHAKPETAPGAWIAFRDSTAFADVRAASQKIKLPEFTSDYTFLMERLPDKSTGASKIGPDDIRYGGYARRLPADASMRLKANAAFLQSLKTPCKLSVIYFDDAAGSSFSVTAAGKTWQILMRGGKNWETAVFDLDAPSFQADADGAQVVIKNGGAAVSLHMVAIERK